MTKNNLFFVCGTPSDREGFKYKCLSGNVLPGAYLDRDPGDHSEGDFAIDVVSVDDGKFILYVDYRSITPNDGRGNRGAYIAGGFMIHLGGTIHDIANGIARVSEIVGALTSKLNDKGAFPTGFNLEEFSHSGTHSRSYDSLLSPYFLADLIFQASNAQGAFEHREGRITLNAADVEIEKKIADFEFYETPKNDGLIKQHRLEAEKTSRESEERLKELAQKYAELQKTKRLLDQQDAELQKTKGQLAQTDAELQRTIERHQSIEELMAQINRLSGQIDTKPREHRVIEAPTEEIRPPTEHLRGNSSHGREKNIPKVAYENFNPASPTQKNRAEYPAKNLSTNTLVKPSHPAYSDPQSRNSKRHSRSTASSSRFWSKIKALDLLDWLIISVCIAILITIIYRVTVPDHFGGEKPSEGVNGLQDNIVDDNGTEDDEDGEKNGSSWQERIMSNKKSR